MKILFITPSYKPAYTYGGTIVVVGLLAETLAKEGHQVTVYTTTANGKNELPLTPNSVLDVEGVYVHYFKRNSGDHTHSSFSLWKHLLKNVKNFDVVHVHSWWNVLTLGSVLICTQKGVTPVLSPHGMFSSYIQNTNHAIKKRWMHWLIGKKLLRATILHVSSVMEWDECQEFLPKWPGRIIPNLVVLPQKIPQRKPNGIFTVGFLSRIDPKKGLNLLIEALSKVDFPFRLLIGGHGDEGYILHLKDLASGLGIKDCIEWVGWQNNEQKFAFLSQLDLFSLTSQSENFAIVTIEALSLGTPVLLSNRMGLSVYVSEKKLGWVTNLQPEQISTILTQAYSDSEKRKRINREGPVVIKEDFEAHRLADCYIEFYKEVLLDT